MTQITCSHCGKSFSNDTRDYNYSNDYNTAYFRDYYGYKLYHFCCKGHFEQFKKMTDMTHVNPTGMTSDEECDLEREKFRNEQRREEERNNYTCEHCGDRYLKKTGVSAYFRTSDKSFRLYKFCGDSCFENFKKETTNTHVNSDGLTWKESNKIKLETEENEKEIKIFTNKVLNDLLKSSTKQFSDIFQKHYNKVPSETNLEYINKCAMSLVRKCQDEMHENVKIIDPYNKKVTIINKRRTIFNVYYNRLNTYTWENVVECLVVKKETEITGTIVEPKKKQPEIVEEFTKGIDEIKTEFKKAFTDIKDSFKNIFKK